MQDTNCKGIAIGAGLLFIMMVVANVLRSRVFATVSNRVSREISQSVVRETIT
ncbi:hypothetical protein O9993_19215 [Vibrio lentus]|nr:hypothetical protein [Vibrio lentus]